MSIGLADSDRSQLSGEAAISFRARCVEFLEPFSGQPPGIEEARTFLRAAAEAGLGGVVYDMEFGGAGLTTAHDLIWRSEKAKHGAPDSEFVISHGMCLPVINDFGTDEQKRTYMPSLIRGDTMWCQMFSEPNAGSDVASLQSTAILDGDEWVINGQKVWTTLAHRSDFGVMIARTDPDVSKHAGISMFIVDMKAPGILIRPIHQIDGGRHFNEVFFDDVRVSRDNLLGELNNGWSQATAMLMYERVAIGGLGAGSIAQPRYDELLDAARRTGRIDDPVVRDDLMKLYSMETTKAMVAIRARAEVEHGRAPGPGGSLGKLAGSLIMWKFRETAQNMTGPELVAWDTDDPRGGQLGVRVLSSFQAGIAGGTDEIQRNIIGERVLGLPRR